MIGLVVVSHSRALAEAAVALAGEMLSGDERPQLMAVGGTSDGGFGTDAAAVSEAVTAADTGDGVLLLCDLGSAVLSAEMALEFVDPELATRCLITPAPLVEGLVAATVAAGRGACVAECEMEARRGVMAKQAHIDGDLPEFNAAPETPEGVEELRFTVHDPAGLHVRPAAKVVEILDDFDAKVQLFNLTTGAGPADADSVITIATLGIECGHEVRAAAVGDEACEALAALRAVVSQEDPV